MELTGKQKARLRKLANQKEIMFQIGQTGITDQVVKNILTNLDKHEIGRVSILKSCPDSKADVIAAIEAVGIMVVYSIGHVLLLYKENRKLKDRIRL